MTKTARLLPPMVLSDEEMPLFVAALMDLTVFLLVSIKTDARAKIEGELFRTVSNCAFDGASMEVELGVIRKLRVFLNAASSL